MYARCQGDLGALSTSLMFVSAAVGGTVIDETRLSGNYSITLEWTPVAGASIAPPSDAPNLPSPESAGPTIFTAIQEQLGLKLQSKKGPVEIIVIDHVERPSEN